jgi:WD40 repeat protein
VLTGNAAIEHGHTKALVLRLTVTRIARMSMQMLKLFPAAHQERITCVAVDPAHNQIFVAAQSPNIFVWSSSSHSSQPIAVMKGHKGEVTGLVYFTGMGLVISSSLEGTCIFWDDRFKVLQVGCFSSCIGCVWGAELQSVNKNVFCRCSMQGHPSVASHGIKNRP